MALRRSDDRRGEPPGDESDKHLWAANRYDRAYDELFDVQSNVTGQIASALRAEREQTAVDAEQQIVIGAELTQCAADSGELIPMLAAVEANLGATPEQMLADAGYRDEAVFAALAERATDLIVSLAREGRKIGKIDAENEPHTAAMAERLSSEAGRAAYACRKHIVEPPNGWIKSVLGFRQFSLRGWRRCARSGSW